MVLWVIVFEKYSSVVCMKQIATGYMNFNDGKIYYEIHGMDNISSEPIFILHGGPAIDHTYLTPQLFSLAKHHRVVFYDQRGVGKSTNTPYDNQHMSNEKYVEDLEALRKHLGYKKIILLGHSYGGYLAMKYSITYTDCVSHMILANSSAANNTGINMFFESWQERMKPIQSQLDQITTSSKYQSHDLDMTNQYLNLVFAQYFCNKSKFEELTPDTLSGYWETIGVMSDALTEPFDFLASLRKLNIPTLIIHGKEDIVPLSTVEEIHEVLPDSKLVVIKDCDHFPYIEKPTEFFSAIEEFLNSKRGDKKYSVTSSLL